MAAYNLGVWEAYPADYRAREVGRIVAAARAGDSVALIGLSGAGKSNLLGFVAHRASAPRVHFALVDCNRLTEPSPEALFRLMSRVLSDPPDRHGLDSLEAAIGQRLADGGTLSILIDRFDALMPYSPMLLANLRALRDAHKFRLGYVLSMRHALDPRNELAELLHAHTIWLGPLADNDARWTIRRYAERHGLTWPESVADGLIAITRGYPGLLRAACEAWADLGAGESRLDERIADHPSVRARVQELLADQPTDDELRQCGLAGVALLARAVPSGMDLTQLTAKEHSLLKYLQAHPNEVCAKDDLMRAVWSEDRAFGQGLRDDALAQLVRRLREKIEPDPSHPRHVLTTPGRGYRYVP